MPGQIYTKAYLQPSILAAAERAVQAAAAHGITGHAMALRWTMHSGVLDGGRGDAVIVASSNLAQLEENFAALEAGPLPGDVVEALEVLRGEVGDEVAYHL